VIEMNVKNTSKRGYTLPLRTGPDGSTVGGAGVAIGAGASVDLPRWYIEELMVERGFANLFAQKVLVDGAERPALSASERRIAQLEAEVHDLRAEARTAQDAAAAAKAKVAAAAATDKRIAELEAEVAAHTASKGKRIEELEQQLAAAKKKAEKGEKSKPEGEPDPKPDPKS
jgi:hypothetical protein